MGVAEVISGRLADGELVIIDGGTSSQLQADGVPMDDLVWSARANLEQPDLVQRVHEAYIRADAEVIIANTFAASRAALEPAGLGSRVAEANRSGVAAALRAREAAASRPVAVAGSMSSFCPIAMEDGAGTGAAPAHRARARRRSDPAVRLARSDSGGFGLAEAAAEPLVQREAAGEVAKRLIMVAEAVQAAPRRRLHAARAAVSPSRVAAASAARSVAAHSWWCPRGCRKGAMAQGSCQAWIATLACSALATGMAAWPAQLC
jgi:hypothetical protein